MLGNCYGIYMDRLDERWLRPLADAAIFFARHETQGNIADRIMGDGRFTQTDQCRRVRKAAVAMLESAMGVASYKPAEIQRLVSWAMANDPAVEQPEWRQIAALRKRWDEEKKPEVRRQLAQPLSANSSSRLTPEEWIGFLRVQWKSSPPSIARRRAATVRGTDRAAVVAGRRGRGVRFVGKTRRRTKGAGDPAGHPARHPLPAHRSDGRRPISGEDESRRAS